MRDYQSIDAPAKEARHAPAKRRSRRRTSSSSTTGNSRDRAASPKVLTRIPSLATADPLVAADRDQSGGEGRLLSPWVSKKILAGGMAVLLSAAVITAVHQFSQGKEDKKDAPSQAAQKSSPRTEASTWQAGTRPAEPSDGVSLPSGGALYSPPYGQDAGGQSSRPSSPNLPAVYAAPLDPAGATPAGHGGYPPPTANRSMAIADRGPLGAAGRDQDYASLGGSGGPSPSTTGQPSMWLDYQDYAALAALQVPTLATETARAAASVRLQEYSHPLNGQRTGPSGYADRGGTSRNTPAGSIPVYQREAAATSYGSGDPSIGYPPRYPSTGYPPADFASAGSATLPPGADVSARAAAPGAARLEGTIQKPPIQTTYERTRSSLY